MTERSTTLCALRAWAGLSQGAAATAAGIATRTLHMAEAGALCTDKTWAKMLAAYEVQGLRYVEGPPERIERH